MRGRVLPAGSTRTALERARPFIITGMVPVVVLAVGSLVLEYGFHTAAGTWGILHAIEILALGGLLLEPLLNLLLTQDRAEVLRSRWFHFALAGLYAIFVGLVFSARLPDAGVWALKAAHVTIILSLLARLVELNRFLASLRVRPSLLFVGSFATLIAFGTGLLLLPVATAPGRPATSFTDALFTATSAVCVTGLTVVDTGSHWSSLGRYVVLTLVQLGGLGLMTFGSIFAVLLWRGMRVREAVVMREALSRDLLATVGRVVIFILLTTVAVEAAGAALMLGVWDHTASGAPSAPADRIAYSVFHSICAFCNAGFALYGNNLADFAHTWQIQIVIPLLIISGGLGFGVLYNFARLLRYRLFSNRKVPLAKKRLALHSKLAILMTAALLAGGTLLIFVFETFPGRSGVWRVTASMPSQAGEPSGASWSGPRADAEAEAPPLGEDWHQRLRNAWFLSTTSRTAGFSTTDTRRLSPPTKFLAAVLMFIGASPGSTGGGIKTVTTAVILLGIWATLRGAASVQAFRRAIAWGTVQRALALLAVSVIWVTTVTLIICAWGLHPAAQFTFLDVLFETTSAFGTVGLSTGTTPLLNVLGRILIIATMFVGRVGPLTLFVAMQVRTETPRYAYAPEVVAIS